MKVLNISTHNENCGIGKYQEQYIDAFRDIDNSDQHDFFPYSPNVIRYMNDAELTKVYDELRSTVGNYDLVHIQHEFSFFQKNQLQHIVDIIKSARKPLVSTIHTKPTLEKTTRPIYTPKGIPARIKNKINNTSHLELVLPLAISEAVFVHNTFTRDGLINAGFHPDSIKLIPIPVPVTADKAFRAEVDDLSSQIQRKTGDIVLATVGYLNDVKGTLIALKALRFLPSHYKLTILGGLHPQAENEEFLDKVADYIIDHSLRDRVAITGFVEDNDLLNAYVKNVDIVLFPYMRVYGSSSAALNNGFAAHKPIVATPVKAFLEINARQPYIRLSESFSYYDVARVVASLDQKALRAQTELSQAYAEENSYPKLARKILDTYREVIG